MKKSIKTMAVTLLAAGMLAGCSSGGPADWSAEDKEAMKEALYGVELPYAAGFGELTPDIDAAGGKVSVYGQEGLETSPEALLGYAMNFAGEESKWEILVDKCIIYEEPTATRGEEEMPTIIQYVFEQSVKVEGEDKFVRLTFGSYTYDSEGYAEAALNGEFALWASDPYYYDWTGVQGMFDVVKNYYEWTYSVQEPSFESTRFEFDINEEANLFYANCYLDGSVDPSTCAESYKNKLVNTGHFYDYGYDAEKGVYVAVDEKEEFTILYGLSNINVFTIAVYPQALYTLKFPSDFADLFTSLMYSAVSTIPSPEADYFSWVLDEETYAFVVNCFWRASSVVPEDPVSDYELVLESNKWYVLGEDDSIGANVSVSPDSQYAIAYYFDEGVLYVSPFDYYSYYGGLTLESWSKAKELMSNYFEAQGEKSALSFADFAIASEEGYVELEPYGGVLYVYAVWATVEEYNTFVSGLVTSHGWKVEEGPDEEYPYYYKLSSGTGSFLYLDYTEADPEDEESEAYASISLVFISPATPDFPLDKVNAFLATDDAYDFSFTEDLAAAFVDPEKAGYSFSSGYDSYGYPYIQITVEGDQSAAWSEAIAAVLEGSTFVYDEEDGCYYNPYYYCVAVDYVSDYNVTYLYIC